MEKGESSTRGNKFERKTMEKNRRIHFKNLCAELVSVIPSDHFKLPKEFLSQQDQIEQATDYIKISRERIEELRRRKTQLALMKANNDVNTLEIREYGSSLEVVLISGIMKNFMLSQVITMIEQGGAEVVTVNVSNVGDKIFHTLHAKVKFSRVGIDTVSIQEKIQKLIN